MPDLRLSAEEREPLVAYLTTLRKEGADAVIPQWPETKPELVEEGRKLVQKLGCYGCHDIPGFEAAGAPGADLDTFGDKRREFLAWGEAKKQLFELVNGELSAARVRYTDLMDDPVYIESVLKKGAERARHHSVALMEKVREAVGISPMG